MKVQCQTCRGLFEADPGMAGRIVQCPYCRNSVTIQIAPTGVYPGTQAVPVAGNRPLWQNNPGKSFKMILKKILFIISCVLFLVSFIFVFGGLRGGYAYYVPTNYSDSVSVGESSYATYINATRMMDYHLSNELFNIAFALQGTAVFLLLISIFWERIWSDRPESGN